MQEVDMEAISKEWEEVHHDREWGRYPGEPVIRFVARNFYKCKRDEIKILDYGCGQGAHTWYLAREGFDTYALDGSASAVEKAKIYLEKEGVNAKFDVMDGTAITYQNDFFDGVIDSACVGHNKLDNIEKMYSEIYRVLKDEGKLFTTFFSTKTSGFGTGEKIEKNTFKNVTEGPLAGLGIVHFWEEDEFIETLKNVGFTDIEVEKVSFTNRGSYIDSFILMAVKGKRA